MSRTLDVLLFHEPEVDVGTIQNVLRKNNEFKIQLENVTSPDEAVKRLRSTSFQVVFLASSVSQGTGLGRLAPIFDFCEDVPLVVIAQDGDEHSAVRAFRLGAEDYIPLENLNPSVLFSTLRDAVDRFEQQKARRRMIDFLKSRVRRDDLTFLLNRRAFRSRLREEMKRARRYQIDLCLLMMDVDNFKAVNDLCGHVEGDKVLQKIARVLESTIRATDVAGRYGGDEFCIIVTETSLREARNLAARLQENISRAFGPWNGEHMRVSCSIGLASLQPEDPDVDALIDRADRSMYRIKNGQNSRHQAGVYRQPEEPRFGFDT